MMMAPVVGISEEPLLKSSWARGTPLPVSATAIPTWTPSGSGTTKYCDSVPSTGNARRCTPDGGPTGVLEPYESDCVRRAAVDRCDLVDRRFTKGKRRCATPRDLFIVAVTPAASDEDMELGSSTMSRQERVGRESQD